MGVAAQENNMSGNRATPMLYDGQSSPFNIYTQYLGTDRPHVVGTRGFLEDGRVFYWARNATTAAVNIGELACSPAVTALHQTQTVAAAGDFTQGAMDVKLNIGATALNLREYEEGYVGVVFGVTGMTQYYQIRRHNGGAASTVVVARLYTPVQSTNDATAKFSLVRNPYQAVRQSVAASSTVMLPAGVPQVTLAAATSAATATAEAVGTTYGWLQTWGPALVLSGATVATVGKAMTISPNTNGAIELDNTATTVSQQFLVGYNMEPTTAASWNLYDLRIRP